MRLERVEGLQCKSDSGISFYSHNLQCVKELLALAGEESIGGEACDRGDGACKSIRQGTNDRDMGKVGADEFAWDGKDQAGLNEARRLQWWIVEEIRKRQAGNGIGKWRHWLLHSIARKINPFEEVSDLVSTDTEGDLEHLRIRHFLAQGCVETGAALLNVSKVKGCYVGDCLNVIVPKEVGVGCAVEVGIVSGMAVTPLRVIAWES